MEIIFNEKYLQEMYLTGQTDKKHRYQPQVVRKYIRVIDIMIDAPDVQGLLRYNSLNYEKPVPHRVRRTGAGGRNHRYDMQHH